ncbi:hypothetical protein R0H17_09095 [Phytobacter diazotrophicus]|jgi:DNA polymerase V|uniref:hypothetical protein n=1 Tax=Phytobacter diazotrophicus TaxID=395631 RepID=UPI0029368BED|nr:hypothetical protein [Phytobacter diazotrophicus]MDV2901784.1 hypothetical protein [Phytobacter diazotrophicus]
MGFVSPATDYAETRLTLDAICGMKPTCGVLPTSTGYAVIDASLATIEQGCIVVISLYGATQFAKLMGTAFITEDGEAIEGEALEDIVVLGRVTYFVNRAGEDDSPII